VFRANKIVLPGIFTVDGFCDLVQTERVTQVAVVPTILALLLEYKDIDRYDLSSLVGVGVGGGALPLGLKEKIEKRIPQIRATSGYGMTETTSVISRAPDTQPPGSVGLRLPYSRIRIVTLGADQVATDCALGQSGVVLVKGPQIFAGYKAANDNA
jgi:acyl-CoA synthetase (AMP-forming)/AMP-acid ligase II